MHRVVFDTVVFVRCLINPHSIWGRGVFQYAGRYRLIVSGPVLQEYLDVLNRPQLTRKFRTLASMDWATVIRILGQADIVELSDIPPVSRDRDDDKFLATALAGAATYLVSEDHDLLSLERYRSTTIVTMARFLQALDDA